MTAKQTDATTSISARLEEAREELREAATRLQESLKIATGKVEENFQSLREQVTRTAEKVRSEGLAPTARTAFDSTSASVRDLANRAMSTLGLPTSDDVQALNKKLDTLSRKIRKLEKANAA